MSQAAILLAALLALFPRAASVRRIEARQNEIARVAQVAAEAHHIPVSVLLVVGFMETHLGTDANEGGNWGAPIDAHHRHTPGTPDSAARILEHSLTACHTWPGAISRFRCGLCVCPERTAPYTHNVMHLIARVHNRAGVPVPAELQPHRSHTASR